MHCTFNSTLFQTRWLLFLLCLISCENSGEQADCKSKSLSIVMFIDAIGDGGQPFAKHFQNIFRGYLQPKIEAYCTSNRKRGAFKLDLTIYPIDGNTELASPLASFQIADREIKQIKTIRGAWDKEMKRLKDELESSLDSYQNDQHQLRILPTLPILAKELKSIQKERPEEEVIVVYISDLVEMYYPSQPEIGFFGFLQKGTDITDDFAVNSALNQIEDKDSWINRYILEPATNDLSKRPGNCRVIFFRPQNIKPQTGLNGIGFNQISHFWKRIFTKLGMEIEIKTIKSLSDDLNLINC